MRAESGKARQRGFSLPETLIAAAIVAGVVAAAAQSISASVRLSNRVNEEQAFVGEAQAITARLRAGMTDRQALQGFDHWSIKRDKVPPFNAGDASPFDRITLTREGREQEAIALWAPTAQQEPAP